MTRSDGVCVDITDDLDLAEAHIAAALAFTEGKLVAPDRAQTATNDLNVALEYIAAHRATRRESAQNSGALRGEVSPGAAAATREGALAEPSPLAARDSGEAAVLRPERAPLKPKDLVYMQGFDDGFETAMVQPGMSKAPLDARHPWADLVATAVRFADGAATQNDLLVAVRTMQDKAYGICVEGVPPRSLYSPPSTAGDNSDDDDDEDLPCMSATGEKT